MDFDSIRPVISGLIGATAAEALRRTAARRQAPVTSDGVILRYPRSLQAFLWLTVLVFGFFTVFNALGGNVVNSYAVAVSVPLILAAVSAYGLLETARVVIVVGDASIRCHSPWGPARQVPYSSITHASYAPALGCFVLRTRDHGTVRVSTMLVGVAALPAILEQHGIAIQ